MRALVLFVVVAFFTGAPYAQTSPEEPKRERITDRKKGESTGKKIARFPIRLAFSPLWVLDRGLYHGMVLVDEKNLVARAIYLKNVFRKYRLTPHIGGAGDGAGFGGGVTWVAYGGVVKKTWSVSGSINGYQDHHVDVDFLDLFGEELRVVTAIHYRSKPEEDFFGIGPNSREENRTTYNLEQTVVTLDVEIPIASVLTVAGQVEFSDNNIYSGEDEAFPSTEDLFTSAEVAGLDTGAEIVTGDVALTLDLRDHPGDATAGGLLRVFAGIGEDTEGDAFNYWHYGAEVEGFLPLLGWRSRFGPRSVLAVRVQGDFYQPRNGGTVPFFNMPYLGGSSTLRGFREFRFYDQDVVFANFEYRWSLNYLKSDPLVEAVLFLDEGQVFNRSDDFDFDSFRESFGGGIRVAFKHNVLFRVEAGRSTEGTRVFTKFELIF
ncbi:MAG: BamA/TamA family outer membrane protein [Candidatus Krumholzibacteria bacterium]